MTLKKYQINTKRNRGQSLQIQICLEHEPLTGEHQGESPGMNLNFAFWS